MNIKEFLVVIPARAGSKRIKNKNRVLFNNKPLIVQSIEYAKKNIGADIVINTNDKLISPIAEQYGLEIMWREEHLAQDQSSTLDMLKDVVEKVSKKYKYVVLLQPTNPLRPKNLFKECLDLLSKNQDQSVITVGKNKEKLGTINNEVYQPTSYFFGQRSQDLKPLFYENGLMYIIPFSIIKQGKLMSEKPSACIVNHPYSTVDIDYDIDLKWAEFISKNYSDE
jgi:N-acylneuraminate cytidylyltransferase